jgi:RNA polymerase sigma factor (sigma-70 family)
VILVTGAAGLSGSIVIREFARQKTPVRALVRSRAKAPAFEMLPTVEFVEADMLRPETLRAASRHARIIRDSTYHVRGVRAPKRSTFSRRIASQNRLPITRRFTARKNISLVKMSSADKPDSLRLLDRAKRGDRDAFQRLAEPYRRELQLHCYRMLGSLHDAEDLVQETFLRAWRGLDHFEGRASFRNWLYRIATNTCLNAMASRLTSHRVLPEIYGPPSDQLPNGWHAWAHQVQLDFVELRAYARAVYSSTDKYFDTLPDDALDQPRGELPASVLNALLLTLSMRRGEIACLHALEC